jgi:AraC-like DNA-binding protein
MRIASTPSPPEPARALAAHLLRAAAGFSQLPAWMERHALTSMSPRARQHVWAVGRRFTGNPDHGFAIAERVPAQGVGSLWDLYRCAPNLAALHEAYPGVAPLLVDAAQCGVEVQGTARLTYALSVRADRAEEDLRVAMLVKCWYALHGEPITPRSVSFTYARPRSTAAHERALGSCTLRFGQPLLCVELDLRSWNAPLPAANREEFARRLARALERVRRMRRAPLEERLDGLLTQQLTTDASAERIAQLLGVSARSLRRKLAQAGSSLRTLTERARRREDALFAEASALFGFRTLSPTERARLLGFAGAGALRNALRRWTVPS